MRPPFTDIVAALESSVPFEAPEAIERRTGVPLRLRIGANESAFGCSPRAIAAVAETMTRAAWYCDPECAQLRAALSDRIGRPPGEIVVGSGVDDLLGLVVRAFVSPGDRVVMSLGAYPTFAYHVRGYGGLIETVPYVDHANDLEALAQAARTSRAQLLYLSNPDNPTGTWHDADALRKVLEGAPADCMILVDEAYVEFAPDGTSVLDGSDPARLITFRTFSKGYGLAGLRVGYLHAAATVTDGLNRIRTQFGVSSVAQDAALAALGDDAFLESVVAEVARGREEYYAAARAAGLEPVPSATNFVAMDVGSPTAADALLEQLLLEGVFLRKPKAPPINSLVRATVATSGERVEFANALAQTAAVLRTAATTRSTSGK